MNIFPWASCANNHNDGATAHHGDAVEDEQRGGEGSAAVVGAAPAAEAAPESYSHRFEAVIPPMDTGLAASNIWERVQLGAMEATHAL